MDFLPQKSNLLKMVTLTGSLSVPTGTQFSLNLSVQVSPPRHSNTTELTNLRSEAYQPSGAILNMKHSTSSRQHWNPHNYQKRAIQLLLSQASAGLFLDPGLGKTSVVLAALTVLKAKGLFKRALIVVPLLPMATTWPNEIQKWEEFSTLTYAILHGPKKEDALAATTDIHLINPEGLAWLFKHNVSPPHEKGRPPYDVLVIDESSKFKNSQTQRFRLLKPWLDRFKRRWILTGTPTPNGLMDLFGQIFILDLGRSLGRFITHFRQEFFIQGWNEYDWKPKKDAYPLIIERISPLVMRMGADDYLEMPDLVTVDLKVSLPQTARKIYEDVEDEFIALLETGTIVAANEAVAGVKCKQIANGAVYDANLNVTVVHDTKLEVLDNLLEELGGAPTLVLYEFKHDLERLLQRYPYAEVLGSGLSTKDLQALVDRFNRGLVPLLLGHPAGMGHGLNLQESCNHIVWFGIPWNLEHYDQAIARVYRQGQKNKTVFVYHLCAEQTVDVLALRRLKSKSKVQITLLDDLHAYRQEHLDVA